MNEPIFDKVRAIANDLTNKFLEKKYDRIILVYNKFKNAASQIPSHEQLLPIQNNSNVNRKSKDYIFEPNSAKIVQSILPKSVNTSLFKSLLESIASEHGARMTAMHKATDNAQELKDGLKLTYNRQRQAAITNEILEIVAGAEALNS